MINTMNKVFFWIKVNEDYVVFSKYKMQPFLIKNYKGNINKIFNNFELQFSPNKQDQIKSQRKFCYIGFNPTDICNMNCKYCFKSNKDDKNKIQIEKLKKSIKKILNLFSDCNDEIQIEISGGEPLIAVDNIVIFSNLLKSEIFYKFKKETNFCYRIITNGTVINKNILNFFKSIKLELGISLDASKLAHNKNRVFTNNKPSYNTIISNMEVLKKHNVTIDSIMITITKNNIDLINLYELEEVLKSNNINKLSFQLNKNWNEMGLFVLEKIKNIIAICHKSHILYSFEADDVILNFLNFQKGNYRLFTNKCGYYNKNFFSLNFDGNIKKCPYINFTIKNLRTKKIYINKCSSCAIESLCPGPCVTVENDTDCYFRQILFESLLRKNCSKFPILDMENKNKKGSR